MGPEFWAGWSERLRARRRLALLFYSQVFPPLAAVVGALLAISAAFGPETRDRADVIAVGILLFVAGSAGTVLVLYIRRLVRRFRSLER